MSVSYFANAALSLEVPAEFHEALHDLYAEVQEDAAVESPRVLTDWPKDYKRRLTAIKDKVSAALGLSQYVGRRVWLIYTGGADEHPGESATDPETWLLGVGVFAFPKIDPRVVRALTEKKAEWRTWVTAGV